MGWKTLFLLSAYQVQTGPSHCHFEIQLKVSFLFFMQNVQVVSLGSLQNGYFQMLMGGQHVVRVFQISQVVVQWSKESESTVRAESIFLSTIILLQSASG